MRNFTYSSVKKILFITLFCFSLHAQAQPLINSIIPSSGAIGSTVNIKGTGFNTTPDSNIVYFGSVKAVVSSATKKLLTVTVPEGATYQSVSVTNERNNLTGYSSAPFVVTFSNSNTSFTFSTFDQKTDFTLPGNCYGIATGDFDGDGKTDIAAVNNANKLSLFRNVSTKSKISFQQRVDFSTGNYPIGISSGDIDGDGKLDLVVTNFNSNSFSFFRNISTIGTISFDVKQDFTTGENPYGIAIGDFDNDGKPDVVVANQYAFPANISVYKNTSSNGVTTFNSQINFSTGSQPRSLSVGDLNADGKVDIVTANQASRSISILQNTTSANSISFAGQLNYSTTGNSSPESVSITDLNNDGKPDIAVACNNDAPATISVFKNISSGPISFTLDNDLTTGTNPFSIAASDLNGDGRVDLAVTNQIANTFSVLRNKTNNSTFQFADKIDYISPVYSRSIVIGDLNGDNKPDIIAGSNDNSSLSAYKNQLDIVLATNKITNFKSTITGTSVMLSWETTELNIASFVLEHSLDGYSFNILNNIATTNSSSNKYSYLDNKPYRGENYYRLKTMNIDGTFEYSNILRVSFNDASVTLTPNPANSFVTVGHPAADKTTYITLYDLSGKMVKTIFVTHNSTQTKINLSGLAKGVYKLFFETANTIKTSTLQIN